MVRLIEYADNYLRHARIFILLSNLDFALLA